VERVCSFHDVRYVYGGLGYDECEGSERMDADDGE
jgi:hypothetical protein